MNEIECCEFPQKGENMQHVWIMVSLFLKQMLEIKKTRKSVFYFSSGSFFVISPEYFPLPQYNFHSEQIVYYVSKARLELEDRGMSVPYV